MINEIPENKPGAVWDMDEEYNKRIEAMEFAMRYDDSRDNSGIKFADVVLIGLSRTSKTPLCKEPRSALESRRVSLGAHCVDSRESSLLRRLERGREIGR